MRIKGKAAIVTGGSRGVGAATVRSLARQGCSVLINYAQSASEAAGVRADAEGCGVKAGLFEGDVSQDEVCRGLVDAAVEMFGRLDILINNAGTTEFIPADDFDSVNDEVWSRLMDVNVKAAFQCVRAARPHLQAAGSAEIVSVASVAAFTGRGSCIPYCASKGALVTMTKSLARVLGPHGVRVNAVAPGFIKGDWLRRGVGENYDAFVAAKEAEAPLQAACSPQDVADAILGLVGGSDLVTGETLTVDAGHTLGDGW
ncbi:MAG: oxidoreductase [Verrucomicrobiaceae bacterium]|nr:oxidoreductase [Verrucomicrobiaceae bacterium]